MTTLLKTNGLKRMRTATMMRAKSRMRSFAVAKSFQESSSNVCRFII